MAQQKLQYVAKRTGEWKDPPVFKNELPDAGINPMEEGQVVALTDEQYEYNKDMFELRDEQDLSDDIPISADMTLAERDALVREGLLRRRDKEIERRRAEDKDPNVRDARRKERDAREERDSREGRVDREKDEEARKQLFGQEEERERERREREEEEGQTPSRGIGAPVPAPTGPAAAAKMGATKKK